LNELRTLAEECSGIRKDKELLQAEHRKVVESLREANQLALQQMHDEHERNKQLMSEHGRLEERVRQLSNTNESLQNNLAAVRL